ncbi:hypothetical protein K2173_006567 [Erythroxylum novogranatense]|uniref:RRM domain-containing protein n=1 Tax=Erythroxylum novogranatense TaxID=1862640 RepID=A0AAV8T5B5_9ROSI|nr:hypothetical protein K2173_006567 [Erythroxylum novogranatense]
MYTRSVAYIAQRAFSVTVPSNTSKLFVAGILCMSIPLSASSFPHNSSSACVSRISQGLSWSVDEKSLKDAFSSFGDVAEVRIVYDKDSGRSRGFGFVSFSKEDEAASAKDAMDGTALMGRPLRVSFALDKVRGAPVVVPRLQPYNRPP